MNKGDKMYQAANGVLRLAIAESKEDKKVADNLVIAHHSYVASARTVGRVIKYLIHYEDRLVGTFWIGSGFKPTPKAILNYFAKSQSEFDKIFNEVADNKRFAMAEIVPNLGTRILKEVRNRAAKDWKSRYGNELQAIITTIGNGKSGSVYLADNWEKIGETSGLPPARKSVSMKWNDSEEIAERFVKPTGENKKIILITRRLAND
jgi:hypothetical protein